MTAKYLKLKIKKNQKWLVKNTVELFIYFLSDLLTNGKLTSKAIKNYTWEYKESLINSKTFVILRIILLKIKSNEAVNTFIIKSLTKEGSNIKIIHLDINKKDNISTQSELILLFKTHIKNIYNTKKLGTTGKDWKNWVKHSIKILVKKKKSNKPLRKICIIWHMIKRYKYRY